jgi:carboxypeptidase PM20D1
MSDREARRHRFSGRALSRHGQGQERREADPDLGAYGRGRGQARRLERDPFTPVIENGYLFGRGASDMKFDLSTFVATLIQLKREGFKPGRDMVLLALGRRGTAMKTTQALAEQFTMPSCCSTSTAAAAIDRRERQAGDLRLQGAEKTYADFELTFTNPGGHSSAPRKSTRSIQLAPR